MRSMSVWAFSVAVGTGLGALIPAPAAADPIPADKLAEPALAVPAGASGAYLRKVHAMVHRRWADNFLRLAAFFAVFLMVDLLASLLAFTL